MLDNLDREQLRQMFVTAWEKRCQGKPLEPLEAMISDIIEMHPEYHSLITSGDDALHKDYSPEDGESNPFLHMGLHIGIREQLSTNRPQGIVDIHSEMSRKIDTQHDVEHRMMDCLVEMIWQSQRNQVMPNEADYLQCLKKQI